MFKISQENDKFYTHTIAAVEGNIMRTMTRARQHTDTYIKILEFEYFGMKNDGVKDSRCDCIIPHGRRINCSANQKNTNAHTFGAKKTRKYGPSKLREKGRNQKNEKQTSIENLRQANS